MRAANGGRRVPKRARWEDCARARQPRFRFHSTVGQAHKIQAGTAERYRSESDAAAKQRAPTQTNGERVRAKKVLVADAGLRQR